MAQVAAAGRPASWSVRTDPAVVATAGVGLILAFLALYPTAMLFYGSVSDAPLGVPGHLTLAHYRTAYGDPNTYRMIGNSFVFASGAAAISLVVAGLLAWVTGRTDAPGRALFELLAGGPNVPPPLLTAAARGVPLSPPLGVINGVAQPRGLPPFYLYSLTGEVLFAGL